MKSIDLNGQQCFEEDLILELEPQDLVSDAGSAEWQLTTELKPRSLASRQWRAISAVRTLQASSAHQVLVLCGSYSVDLPKLAADLLIICGQAVPCVCTDSRRKFLLGAEDGGGLLSGTRSVILPCQMLSGRPKLTTRVRERLRTEPGLKLIVCGDQVDCAQLEAQWPELENALHTDLVLEFPADSGMEILGGLLSHYAAMADLPPFSRDAVEVLCAYACRLSGDRRWVLLPEISLMAVAREAASGAVAGAAVQPRDVVRALAARDFRRNYPAASELRDHRDEQILITTEGEAVGQINGLSVIETPPGNYAYGSPIRITATLRAGGEGDVIDIERKAELAGQIHAKAMMIINGFLTREFGAVLPLPVSASLVFEQNYSEIDGDSASLTGLCAVLSCLADLPLRQDLAVTGAVDQLGNVQPVGGVNEKIEGFFAICRLHGLSGTQGVVIPQSCVPQLVLRPRVVRAVRDGKFHIYTVRHVTGAMKILSSCPWGSADEPQSVCGRVRLRLDEVGRVGSRPWWHFWG